MLESMENSLLFDRDDESLFEYDENHSLDISKTRMSNEVNLGHSVDFWAGIAMIVGLILVRVLLQN